MIKRKGEDLQCVFSVNSQLIIVNVAGKGYCTKTRDQYLHIEKMLNGYRKELVKFGGLYPEVLTKDGFFHGLRLKVTDHNKYINIYTRIQKRRVGKTVYDLSDFDKDFDELINMYMEKADPKFSNAEMLGLLDFDRACTINRDMYRMLARNMLGLPLIPFGGSPVEEVVLAS